MVGLRISTGALFLLTIIAAGCSSGDGDAGVNAGQPPPAARGPASSPTPGSGAGARVITATMDEYTIRLESDRVPAGPVRLAVRNAGTRGHEIQVYPIPDHTGGHGDEMAGDRLVSGAVGRLAMVLPGETKVLDVELPAGGWELGCHLLDAENGRSFDHYERGMKTTLTVAWQ